jgi:3-hydroxyacyl-CoA dehydrogenase/enoyl-CoA hydratase/3-hydroxybutyryl-CoA epimerase
MSSIGYHRDADGIVTLTLDAPGEPVNTMNAAFQADLADRPSPALKPSASRWPA